MINSIKDHGRIKGQYDSEDMEQDVFFGKVGEEAEQTEKPEDERHQGAYIFPDHFEFLIAAVMIADAHIIQGPENGKQQRNDHCNGRHQKNTSQMIAAGNDGGAGVGDRTGEGFDKGQQFSGKEKADADTLKGTKEPMLQRTEGDGFRFLELDQSFLSFLQNQFVDGTQKIEGKAEKKGIPDETETVSIEYHPEALEVGIVEIDREENGKGKYQKDRDHFPGPVAVAGPGF